MFQNIENETLQLLLGCNYGAQYFYSKTRKKVIFSFSHTFFWSFDTSNGNGFKVQYIWAKCLIEILKNTELTNKSGNYCKL